MGHIVEVYEAPFKHDTNMKVLTRGRGRGRGRGRRYVGGNGKGLVHWQACLQELTVLVAHEVLYMMHDNV